MLYLETTSINMADLFQEIQAPFKHLHSRLPAIILSDKVQQFFTMITPTFKTLSNIYFPMYSVASEVYVFPHKMFLKTLAEPDIVVNMMGPKAF